MNDQTPTQPPPDEPGILFGPNGLRAGWGLLLFVLLTLLLTSAASSLTKELRQHLPRISASQMQPHPPGTPNDIPPTRLIVAEGVSLAAVLLATFTLSRIERRPFGAYGLGGERKAPRFLQGLFWGVLCLSLLIATLRLTGAINFDAILLRGTSALGFGLIWALGFLLVAFLEETMLRGYLQSTLARGITAIYKAISKTPHAPAYGFWTAALILSFFFGLGHGSNPGESPLGLLAAGCAGLVFCLSLYRSGSLWWALGFHTAWDWAQSFLYGVADSGNTIQGHLISSHPVGLPILSGGLTGPEGSLFVLPTLALVAAIIVATIPRRGVNPPEAPHTGSPSDPAPAPASAAYRR